MKHLVVVASLVVAPSVSFAQEGAVSQTERNKALVMRFYEEAWHNDNYAVADEIFAPDYIRHDASDAVQGPGEAILQSERARGVKTIVPDLRYDYDVIMADEDMVAVRWTSRGNVAGVPALMRRFVGKSGPVVATGVNMYRFRDGRVVELWNNRDDLTIQRAMGTFRWYAVAGFLIGVLTTMLGGWAVRRWRSARSDVESAGAHAQMFQPLLWTLLVAFFTGRTARPAGVQPKRHVDTHSTGAGIIRLLIPTLVLLLMPLDGWAQQRLPIIDMHLHAYRAAAMGPPPVAMCTPIRSFPAWDPAQPYGPVFMTWLKQPPCDDPVWSPMTDQALMDETLAVMERLNIVGVVSGTADRVERWRAAAPERVIPGLQFNVARDTAITPDSLRRLHAAGRLSVFGEVTNQYAGVAPDDQRMEPYWALAEELDVPVGIHVGGGSPGGHLPRF